MRKPVGTNLHVTGRFKGSAGLHFIQDGRGPDKFSVFEDGGVSVV